MRTIVAFALALALLAGCQREDGLPVAPYDLTPVAADAADMLQQRYAPAQTKIAMPSYDDFGDRLGETLRGRGFAVANEQVPDSVEIRYLIASTPEAAVYLKLVIDGETTYSRMYDEKLRPIGCWAKGVDND